MTVFPIFLTERTEYSDECYGVIGRALAFVTSFEENCKSLVAIMEMKKGLLFEDKQIIEDFHEKLENIWLAMSIRTSTDEFKKCEKALSQNDHVTLEHNGVRFGTLNGDSASEYMGFVNKWLDEILKDAKKARNDIAHDITKGIEHCAEHPERRADRIKEVEALVRRVAEADVHVYNLCQFLTKEPTYKSNYCEDAVKWVCEVECK